MRLFQDIFPGKEFIFIAEIGLNHNGNAEIAGKMIVEAAKAGADAVKFQTFIPENLYSKYSASLLESGVEKETGGKEIEFFSAFTLTKAEYRELKSLAVKNGIEFFSAPFDQESVELLEETGVKFYKVASSEVTNHILLKRIAETGKPVIMSTGISDEHEIESAINLLRKNGTPDIALLHCVSLYPLDHKYANLKRITSLEKKFNTVMGFSDHSKDAKLCELAAAHGARIFEKHFKLNNDLDCPDKEISASPEEFRNIAESVKQVGLIRGSGKINYEGPEESVGRSARRSLFARQLIPKGKKLDICDVIPKRPGIGIPVYKVDDILGKTVKTDIKKDYLLRMEYFE